MKGHRYWYFQYTEPSGRLRQAYVGPDSEPVHRLMERKAETGASAALGPLARSAMALGCADALPRHYRVLRRLADYGFFQAGGALIGTHAFLAYGNMLGVRWGGHERTQDFDAAFVHPKLHVPLQPLPFVEFSLEDVTQAVLLSAEGAVLVNIPAPARYSLHKLLVYGERTEPFRARSSKDLAQAAHLLAFLREYRRDSLDAALDDLLSRGKGWRSRFRQGARALRKAYPVLEAATALANRA